ncbi:myb-related protein 2-like [Phalaenopsis equestris]|uniref:myb-related protein 2-like n=1 Tax=Phalaenopsis equestris TaxID=78828 RepID=UPI0009E2EE48|nr:myb-related protein 2-like [Phalaenopsis equestris]
MYHSLIHNNSNLDSSRTSFPSERHLFMQAARGSGEPGLVLSTDAKPRLKWTPELHSRFVEAVKQLGGAEKATPKTVMRLMGIPGVTLYHLKSHLQKYRLSKNILAQSNGGTENNVKIPTAALDKTSLEGNGSLVNNINFGPHKYKTMQISEALQIQMELN